MGKTPEQIIGTSVLSYAAPEYHELIKKNTVLRYQGIAVEPYEIEIIAPSGEHHWVVVQSNPDPEPGKPGNLNRSYRHHRTQTGGRGTKGERGKNRTIIENMQDLFYRTDLEGTITMVSPRGIRLAG